MKQTMISFIVGLSLMATNSVFATEIIITAPASDTTVVEGDDFFTTVLNDPRDFAQRRDFMWEEMFDESSIGVSNGTWSGTMTETGAYLFPLFQGFPLALNTGLVGANYPLDSEKYTYISIFSTINNRSTKAVYWTREVDWPDGTHKIAYADGYYTNTQLIQHGTDEWVLDRFDLSSNTHWTDEDVKGVRLDPSTGAPAGATVQYTWVRICDPDSAPMQTITWTWSDVPQPDASITPKVNIYIDSDQSGYDGTFLGRTDYDDGSFTFPTASLPPGTYYFYLKLFDNTDGDTLLATSGYSAALIVNGKTTITFSNPSMTSGPDYAQQVVGNSWDMEDSADVVNLGNPMDEKNFQNESFSDGAFSAVAIIPAGSAQTESDSQVWLNVDSDNPIDTSKYRYLTYEMAIDETLYGDISDKVERGWISRVIWWDQGIQEDGSSTKGNIVYEGEKSYFIDLRKADVLAPDDDYPKQSGWTGNATLSHLRLDMTETDVDTWFYLYDVKLTANPEPDDDNTFTIEFTTIDPEDEDAEIEFFRDDDQMGYDGVSIGEAFFSPGENSFSFGTSALPPADYYIYAVVTDTSGNEFRRYADVPITVGVPVWHNWFAVDLTETPMVGDFNGDGMTDIITFTRDNPYAVGDVYVALSDGTKFGENTKWHDWFAINHDETVVIGDFDGDGVEDIATWLRTTTKQVYVALSYGTGMHTETVWLESIGVDDGDLLFSGNVDGDSYDDLVLFARNQGKVYVALSTGSGFSEPEIWHNFFAVSTYERPRVGDLDADGSDDIITFATDSPTAQGDVYTAISTGSQFGDGANSNKWHDWFSVEPSQIIRIGDLDWDGRDDFFTFMPPPSGQVYTVLSQGSYMADNVLWSEVVATSDTDLPYVGDANGDGKTDIIVFCQGEGTVRVTITP